MSSIFKENQIIPNMKSLDRVLGSHCLGALVYIWCNVKTEIWGTQTELFIETLNFDFYHAFLILYIVFRKSKDILPWEYQLRYIPTQQQHTGQPGNQFCTEEPPKGQTDKEIYEHWKSQHICVQKKHQLY